MDGKDEEIKSFKHRKKAGKILNNAHDELDKILGSKEELRLSNSYNRDLIEGSVDPLFIIDLDGKLKDVNKAVELVTGYSRDQLIGTDFLDYFTNPDKAKAGYEEVSREGFVKDYPLEILHKNGDTTPVSYNASIYKDEKGQTIGVFAAERDISQLKTAKEKLKEHMDNLERTVKNRTDELIHANDLLKTEIKERKKMEKTLRVSEERYSITLDAINDGLWDWDVSSGDAFFSNNYYKMLGYDPGEFPANYESWRLLVHPDEIDSLEKQLQESLKTGRGFEIDLRIKTKSEKWLWVSARGKEIEKDSTGNPRRIVGTLSDITDSKKAEEKLKESEGFLRGLFDNMPSGMSVYHVKNDGSKGIDYIIKEFNLTSQKIEGMKREEVVGKNLYDIRPNIDEYGLIAILKKVWDTGKPIHYPAKIYEDEKYANWYENYVFKAPTGEIVAIYNDVTEQERAKKEIKQSLEEKEMLLKEIHHRVKNNLMIISSLLNLQSQYITDKASQDVFKESQNRARSMALIHERLYHSTDLKRIDFGEYISSLATELFHTYEADPGLIKLNINVENILLDINTAIPLGLIVNELITNSLTHAFPKGNKGEINVDFHPKDDHYEFTVKDNGIGFPEDIDFQNTDSLGLQLINSLTSQINGEIELDRNNGTEFKIIFKELECNKG